MANRVSPELGRMNPSPAPRPIRLSDLPAFDVQKHWDGDSTPVELAALSRAIGEVFPGSGARTPVIEAAIFMASLMHDCAYYYGGDVAQKQTADELFQAQIVRFATMLDPDTYSPAHVAAKLDKIAVKLGGGAPFDEPYSWSFGFADQKERGYRPLAPGEEQKIREHGQSVVKATVQAIATKQFETSALLERKLSTMDPTYRKQVVGEVNRLAGMLNHVFTEKWQSPGQSLKPTQIAGFEKE